MQLRVEVARAPGVLHGLQRHAAHALVYHRPMRSSLACLSNRSRFLGLLGLLAFLATGCGDKCDSAATEGPGFVPCPISVTVLAELPAGEVPTITAAGSSAPQACTTDAIAASYTCTILAGRPAAGTTLEVTLAAAGAPARTTTVVFDAPLSSACGACPSIEALSPVDLRPSTADSGLPPAPS